MDTFKIWIESLKHYKPVDKSLSTFVRYGGLSPVKQKGYKQHKTSNVTFHTPPARRGVYAFPLKWVERFLLGGTGREKERPRHFNYTGDIWHHLDVNEDDIIGRRGGWVKTSFDVWSKAFKRALHNQKSSRNYNLNRYRAGANMEGDFGDIIPYSGDHVEVFIERI